MTSSGDSSVAYLCPRCQAKLTANVKDAGQRRECPQCGKLVKVPGTPPAGRAVPASPPKCGIANIPLTCPLCGTRMYAARQQVGQSMVCPDCLESVVVPDQSPPQGEPKTSPTSTLPSPPRPDSVSPRGVAGDQDREGGDELRLSDPIELPPHRSISRELWESLVQHAPEDAENEPPAAAAIDPPNAPRSQPPVEFAVKCPVCDTRVYATEEDIGQQKRCPDCYSEIQISPPRPKPRRVNEVVDTDYPDDEQFELTAPAELEIYRPSDRHGHTRTLGEEALRKAERELAEREYDDTYLPAAPFWNHVFLFLPHHAVITRLVVAGALVGILLGMALSVPGLAHSGSPLAQLGGLGITVASLLLTIICFSYIGVNCLTILQETAAGNDRIECWPESNLVDWLSESFAIFMAMFFSITPGMPLWWTAKWTGIPLSVCWLFVASSLYLCFPIVLLSILESSSLATALSRPILNSVRHESRLWLTFYVIALAIALPVAISLLALRPDTSLFVLILVGIFWVFASFMYFRFLGRLAWACQVRPLQQPGETEQQNAPPVSEDRK